MKTKAHGLPLLALALLVGAPTLASAQGDWILYENDEVQSGLGTYARGDSGGDGDIKSHGLINVPYDTVSVDLSYWEAKAYAGSTLKIQVYELNANPIFGPYSETTLLPNAFEQFAQGVRVSVPRNKSFTIHLRASCQQYPPDRFHDATVTYNRVFRVYVPLSP